MDKQTLVTDAQNRAWRSLLQGGAIDVLAAAALTVYTFLNGSEPFAWAVLGALVAKSVGVAAASYIMRRFMDPSTTIPTPLPPTEDASTFVGVHRAAA